MPVVSPYPCLDQLFGPDPHPLVFPIVVADHAARIAGRRVSEVVTDGQLLAEVLRNAWRTYQYDLILVFADTTIEAEALGSRITMPDDDVPHLDSDSPVEPRSRIPVILDATRSLRQDPGEDVPILTSLKGPFSLAAFLAGLEPFLISMITDPDECHRILRRALEHQFGYADAIIDAGGIPFIGDPVASGDIISRRAFKTYALPYLRELVAHIRTRVRPVGLHICGDTTEFLPFLADIGADIYSLDAIDFRRARTILGPDVVLMGNVPTNLIGQGSPGQVRQAARDCLDAAGPRLILATACDVPRDAPPENVHALVAAGRE